MNGAGSPTLFRRLLSGLLASSGIGLAVMVGWWMQIEDARNGDGPAEARLNQPLDLGRVRLVPLAVMQMPQASDQGPGLVLEARLENVTGESQAHPFGFPPKLPQATIGGVALDAPQLVLVRDEAPLPQLQPRLPEAVRLVWSVPRPETAEVVITFYREKFKLHDNLYGRAAWLGHDPVARLVVTGATP